MINTQHFGVSLKSIAIGCATDIMGRLLIRKSMAEITVEEVGQQIVSLYKKIYEGLKEEEGDGKQD